MAAQACPDRLALWIFIRISDLQDDSAALVRVGWAVRRLAGGQGHVKQDAIEDHCRGDML